MPKSLREELAALPFVSVRQDQTLNLWDPEVRPGVVAPFDQGREALAAYVRFLRKHDCLSVTHRVFEAQMAAAATDPMFLHGWFFEFSETVLQAPSDATAVYALTQTPPRAAEEALTGLPFVRTVDGVQRLWVISRQADVSEAQARGRYFAAMLVRAAVETRCAGMIWAVFEAISADRRRHAEYESVLVGFNTQLTEIMMACPEGATRYQEAAPAARGVAA